MPHKALTPEQRLEADLADYLGQFIDDPLGFVLAAFPWGEPDGPLADQDGPDTWQHDFLVNLGQQVTARAFDGVHAVAPIRGAASSGHGIGKSTLQAWIVTWIMTTRPNCRGTVTANTATQLDTKTWAAIMTWAKRSLAAHWFEINTARYYRKGARESWFCAPQSCEEKNSEAFAGQHAADSTSFYIFDEDSAVPDIIHQVAEGGLTDGEPMIFLFGNPTRSSGMFYQACFGAQRHLWHAQIIDSRTSRFTNKAQFQEWADTYGEDSDFFRVRVRGLPPKSSDLQYIATDSVEAAMARELAHVLPDEPLVCGLDVARGGGDQCVFWFRRGLDARTVPAIRLPGEVVRDSMRLVSLAADILDRIYGTQPVAMMFIDGTGVGGPIVDRLKQLGRQNVVEVQFGADSPDSQQANMRAYMWAKVREWLPRGCLPRDVALSMELTAPNYGHDKRDRLVLESKEHMKDRGVASPDAADALALTFAARVKPTQMGRVRVAVPLPTPGPHSWMG